MKEDLDAASPPERRRIQRDYLGHIMQAVGIILVLGAPLLYWGSSINENLAVLMDHDKANTAAIAAAVSKEIDATSDLAVLKEEMRDIRDAVKKDGGRR